MLSTASETLVNHAPGHHEATRDAWNKYIQPGSKIDREPGLPVNRLSRTFDLHQAYAHLVRR